MDNSTVVIATAKNTKAADVYNALRRSQPRTKKDLQNYVKIFLGINIPHLRICPDHTSPMDYLWHCYNSDFATGPNAKCFRRHAPSVAKTPKCRSSHAKVDRFIAVIATIKSDQVDKLV